MNRGILAKPGDASRPQTVPFRFSRDTFRTRDVALPALIGSATFPWGRVALPPSRVRVAGFARVASPLAMSEPGAALFVFVCWLAVLVVVLVILSNRR